MSLDLLKSVPLPTLDRPFGIEVWPIFEKVYTTVLGYPPLDFEFSQGVTPMSTIRETTIALLSYYTIIFGGRELMRSRPAMKLNGLFMAHNFFLTIASGFLLALFIEQLLPTLWRHGVFFTICDHRGGWTKPLVVLYYLNYITKYIELLDTVFLVLKKKPLTFLHTYHHGATALLCYTQLIGLTAVSWVPITLNLMVHVVMYWYYFQSARGVRVWWKQWITRLQIAQFVIDLGFVYFASYTYFTSTYFPYMPNVGNCAGEEFAAFSGLIILSSYLVLFISFYFATYKKTGKGGRPRRNTGKEAAIAMKNLEIPSVAVQAKANGSPAPTNGTTNGSIQTNGTATSSARTNGPVTRSRKA
ncbi:Fatty acyl-CoA elongase/Polyunsaturated fatty acid specific elongation enzyme [Ophidiomyces ophidiicola]|uniref:Fatty acyl-CoA elongase/Polyunsaturated fatty acid specific elongation enzyme n=1 Tax=Ophidiomyces ophidiicola TaxID=1387563 RepID=A0ACB8V3J8_9EURO|nr:Fatty acyl-CoA elongase/Polyunsaturated fatty acid specific elongation enzyme [Ophidiomyces ophidiicola]KAI1917971.1 Fatty acyl-CoA elongase/Polyunsaturated fatty acid specific elongation enzyme [Ophidiomyces ophidiicola]KAI1926537.1 Fatty acyl-CoA elongase/Polyunsaturated fatty acid specific elongation enzyme [Ophidiomyces ophidiicola]KAI1931565.1 Fatty acyl-CoA elongase/Polyunsaturated fatty acid specific elongation enzyme [Ophidiomyces ophidiicola]KAI1952706.1 Fatty acyl-CoA elongase/Poly